MAARPTAPRSSRWHRLLFAIGGGLWLLVAGGSAAIHWRTVGHHNAATRDLCWITQTESLEHDLFAFEAKLNAAWLDLSRPLPELDEHAANDLRTAHFASLIRPPDMADVKRRCERLAPTLFAQIEALPAARARAPTDDAPLHALLSTAGELAQAMHEVSDGVHRELIAAEQTLDSSGTMLKVFTTATLLAVAFLLLLLRDSSRRERSLVQSRLELADSEQRFRAMADEAPLVLALYDANGQVIFCNRAWRDFAGPPTAANDAEHWKSLLHPEDRERVLVERTRARGERRPYEIEYRIRRRDGEWRWWLSRGVPRRDADGGFLGYAIVQMDITERKQFEERQRESQRMEAMGRLAGGIAHDLNNILTVVLGSTDLLLHAPADAAEVKENAQAIRSAAERAAQLVAQLLAFTRRQLVLPVALDPAEAIVSMQGLLDRLIGEDIELTIDADVGGARVTIDPAQITQVVLNLVINARQAMPQGGRIEIALRKIAVDAAAASRVEGLAAREYVELDVRDSGQGMEDATRRRVFEPFFTTKESTRHAGIGLVTVKAIVDQCGGAISVESEPGRGTTVRLWLPLTQNEATSIPVEPLPNSPELSAREFATILLAEDDGAVRPLVCRYLQTAGYRVIEAASGAEAVARARREPAIDVLLTDVVMPDMGGRALAEAITERHSRAVVLYMSGYTDDEVLRRGVSQDEQPFLSKPFSRERLLAKLSELLAARAASGVRSG